MARCVARRRRGLTSDRPASWWRSVDSVAAIALEAREAARLRVFLARPDEAGSSRARHRLSRARPPALAISSTFDALHLLQIEERSVRPDLDLQDV